MPLNKDEMEEAVKKGIEAWMDKKFLEFGKWSLGTLAVLILGALTYFVLGATGWHK